MAILPKEKPKSYKKKKSIETLKKIKPFLEKESFGTLHCKVVSVHFNVSFCFVILYLFLFANCPESKKGLYLVKYKPFQYLTPRGFEPLLPG